MKVAKLENEIKVQHSNPDFNSRWLRVKEWNEEIRYQKYSKQKAIGIYQSIHELIKALRQLQKEGNFNLSSRRMTNNLLSNRMWVDDAYIYQIA